MLSFDDGLAGPTTLRQVIEWHERTASPIGITRGVLRGMFPAFCEFGMHDVVVMLDRYLPPILLFEEARVDAALALAATRASEPVDILRTRGAAMTDVDVMEVISSALDTVITP